MADSFNELFGLGGHSEDASIEAWWPLQDDAASTSVDDATSNARDGTLEGGSDTSDISAAGPNGWLAKALHLDGSADTIDGGTAVPSAIGTANKYTLGAWVSPDSFGSDGTVVGNFGNASPADNQLLLWVDVGGGNDGIAALATTGGNVVTGTGDNNLSTSTWALVGSTWDGSTVATWKNGVQQSSTTNAGSINTSSTSIWIGSEDGASRYLDGLIAGVFAFSRDLGSAEWLQVNSGPELRSTASGIVFSDAGTFNIGTWALPSPFSAGSNGSQTQEVIAVNAAGTVLDTASTAMGTLDLSAEAGNTCYLLARVSNSGGYDIGDHGSRTSGYGSAGDGYYELASVTAAGGGTDVTISESMSVADTVAADDIVVQAAISESVAVSDAYSALPSVAAVLAESMSVQDAVAASDIVAQAVLAESVTVQDSALVSDVVVEVTVSESLAVADAGTTDSAIEVTISESLTIADGVAVDDIVAEVSISESLAVGDSVAASDIVASATIAESLAVSEDFAGGTVTDVTLAESLAVSDVVAGALGGQEAVGIIPFTAYILHGESSRIPLAPIIESYAWEYWDASEGITYDGGVDNWQGTLQGRNLAYSNGAGRTPPSGFTVAQDGPFHGRPYLKLPRISAAARWQDLAPSVWNFLHDGTTDWTLIIPFNNPTTNHGTLIDTSNEGATAGFRVFRRSDERIQCFMYGDGGALVDNITPAIGTQPDLFQQLLWIDYDQSTGIIRIEIDGVEVATETFPSLSSEDCHGLVLKDPNAGMDLTLPAIFIAKALFTGDEKTYLRTLFQRRFDTPQLTPTIYAGVDESATVDDSGSSEVIVTAPLIGDGVTVGDGLVGD